MRISIRCGQSCAKSQGDRPTCVSFAVTSLHEYEIDVVKLSRAKAETDLSEEFLHYHCKKYDGLGSNHGTTVAAAATSLGTAGQCRERFCPYQPKAKLSGLVTPSITAFADGGKRLLPDLKPMKAKADSIVFSLKGGRPLIAVLDWFSNSYSAVLGVIGMPVSTDRLLGRHAVLIVEWDDESDPGNPRIGFKNSWGSMWGDGGFGRFGLDYFNACGRQLWTLQR